MGTGEVASSWLDYVVAIGTLLASLGALAAVGLTLYLNVWREQRRLPSLTLELTEESTRGVIYDPQEVGGATALAPVNVKNAIGKKSAHRVEVLLSAGYWLGHPGTEADPDEVPFFVEIIHQDPLTWWISDPPQGSGQAVAEIPPGVTRKVLVLLSGHPTTVNESLAPQADAPKGQRIDLHRFLGVFTVVPLSKDTAVWLNNQLAYEIRLTVVGEDIDATSYRTRLRWDGPSFEQLRSSAGPFMIHPVWDPLRRIDTDDWPGPVPADNRGWIASPDPPQA